MNLIPSLHMDCIRRESEPSKISSLLHRRRASVADAHSYLCAVFRGELPWLAVHRPRSESFRAKNKFRRLRGGGPSRFGFRRLRLDWVANFWVARSSGG
jgi:hypothetical protein